MACFSCPDMKAQEKPSYNWPNGKKAAVSLTFDDARASHPTVGADFFRPYGVKATFYVVPSAVESRLEGWKRMVADGHEIGSHSMLHPCTGNFDWSRDKAIENYTQASMREELVESKRKIKELLDVEPVSFAYPCGLKYVGRGIETESYVPVVAELFSSGRGWMDEARNAPSFVDMAQLQGTEMDGKDFESDIKPILDEAIENGYWIVLAGHEIGEGGSQTTKMSMLDELIKYVQQPNSEIWIASVDEIARYIADQRK